MQAHSADMRRNYGTNRSVRWLTTKRKNLGNIRHADAEVNDYYATDPKAVELLLEQEKFKTNIWEPACGEGHISKVLEKHGYSVESTDLIDRGYGLGGQNFLKQPYFTSFPGDIITNPPYKYAKEFVEKALEIIPPGNRVAMLLKLTFLEGQARQKLFRKHPPETVYVSSSRLECGKNGVFQNASSVAYAWFVWQKGYPRPNRA